MSDDIVTFTVDDIELQAPKGSMLIKATDKAGIHIPRFCYHDKLSVAANCRMCLVEVEKAPKPMPACATPIMEGMVVHTRSPKAIAAQKSVMEFLLINHPLDCPICDQGGECELQDISIGFGDDESQYTDIKRVVLDKDIGPLISTELTRCIQCTRCVRFGEEIAGMRELGMVDRGDRERISTFVEKSVDSEMSGNVIDICPVGALTAKPSRFSGRAWEMQQYPSIAPHDAVGSNIFIHTLGGKVNRVVPRQNEAINEVWISDRDRFSYEGLYTDDRATTPMIKQNGEWQETDWDSALRFAAEGLQSVIKNTADELACWISPTATLEEHYLAQKLCRKAGSNHIDHRLRQVDFTDQDSAPVMPWLGKDIESIEKLQAILLVGSHVRKEQPLIAHRFRKAFRHHQVKISSVNPSKFRWRFKTTNELISNAEGMVANLAGIAKAIGGIEQANVAALINAADVNDTHKAVAKELTDAAESATIFLGNIAAQHPQFSVLRALSSAIAQKTGATLAYLPEAVNTAGAWLAGSVPHRLAGGAQANTTGASIVDMIASPKKALITVNVEPEYDVANPSAALKAAKAADFCVAITPYATQIMKDYADVILPMAAFAETSGTYVNAEGLWQSFQGATAPPGEARPGWKIFRVLGNLLNLEGFDYLSSDQIKDDVKQQCLDIQLDNMAPVDAPLAKVASESGLQRVGEVPIYAADSLVRRARSLQKTKDADQSYIKVNSALASKLNLEDGDKVKYTQAGNTDFTTLKVDEYIADDCVWLPAALGISIHMGETYGPIELEKA